MTLWDSCGGIKNLVTLQANPWRVVESQSTLTARNLVTTSEEYDLLEEMLESAKPCIDKTTHYLIFTPFRYPPLKYGSRFGSRFEPSLWYGSLDLETALTEVAYYRLLFLHDTEADLGFINIPLTAFQAAIYTTKSVRLELVPFNHYEAQLSAKSSYIHSQTIGTSMREAGVEAFTYFSARSLTKGINLAAFTASIFCKKETRYVVNFQTWQCIASREFVDFVSQDDLAKMSFKAKNFNSHNELTRHPE